MLSQQPRETRTRRNALVSACGFTTVGCTLVKKWVERR